MDYSTLPLGPNQIRLLTIEPSPPGGNLKSPIKCRMYVRSKPLPTSAPIYDSGTIPPNYISFDHYVPNPPEECFGAAIRRDVAEIQLENIGREIAKEQARHSRKPSALIARAAEKLAAKLHQTTAASTSEDIMVPIDDIPSMLTREDFLSMTRDISSGYPDMSIRTWESGPKTYGKLPLAQLNPFFKIHPQFFGSSAYSGMPLPGEPQQHPKPRDNSWQPENYIALSYAWGLESDDHYTIYINDKPVLVRENLFNALRYMRASLEDYFCPPDATTSTSSSSSSSRNRKTENECTSGAIWIDALCINQLSTPEKNSQVQLMSTIYNCAANILVWLGQETSHSDKVISFLEKKSALQRQEFVEVWDGSDPVTATTWRNMALLRLRTVRTEVLGMLFNNTDMYAAGHPFGPGEAKDLWDFFARGYWRRLWIIQELAMGRPGMAILCGGRITLWRYIRDAVLLFAGVFDQLREAAREDFDRERQQRGGGVEMEMEMEHPIAHVAKIAQLEISGHRRQLPRIDPGQLVLYAPAVMNEGPILGSTLRQAILLGSRAECFKAHDRVYGLLSVPGLPARFQSEIKVDYSKPVGQVFLEFTSVCVEVESLDFLAVVDGVPPLGRKSKDANGEPVEEKIPSWVPDYAAAPERRIGIIEGEWRAGGETGGQFPSFWGMGGSCSPPKVIEGKKLQCTGKVVDVVVAVGAVSEMDLDAARAMLGDGDPSLFGVKHMQQAAEEGANADGTAANILHKVLVGGCDLSGDKKVVERFKALYTAFSEQEPPKGSPSHRNWHFLNSSANLQIQKRPLSSYFSPGQSTAAAAKAAQAHLAMTARTKMRRLIVTKSGLIGLAPITAQLGDKVISIVGYGKPVVACAEQSGQPPEGETEEEQFWREYYAPKVFCLRGEAYVEGMMNLEKMPVNSLKPELMLGSGDLGIGNLVFV
ncbi:HET domain containing protein [Rhypophila decipiens]